MSLVEVGNNAVFVDWKYIDDIRQIRFIHKIHAQRSEGVRGFLFLRKDTSMDRIGPTKSALGTN